MELTEFRLGDRITQMSPGGYWIGFVGMVISVDSSEGKAQVLIVRQDPKNELYKAGSTFDVFMPHCYRLVTEKD